jgi:hypothetical protein
MTISDAGGGAAAGAGGGDGGAAGGAGGGGGEKAYYETFANADLRTHPSVHNFKTVEDLASGYVNLEKRFGIDPKRRIDLPADPNDAEGMRAVYARLGLPEKPEGYGFKLDDKASDGDKAMLAKFVDHAHKAGMPAPMAKAAMEFWTAQVAEATAAQQEAFKAQAAEGKAALQKDWGAAYEPRVKEIGNLLATYGDKALVDELNGEKLGNYPNLARFLGKILDRMAEPGSAGGEGGDADRGNGRPLTPAQATAAARALEGDPIKGAALRDRNHPQHKAVVAERMALLAMTQPAA